MSHREGLSVIQSPEQTCGHKTPIVQEQMGIAAEVLAMVRTIDSTAMIAGGAPRDWYLDKLATDIDIFYYKSGVVDHCVDLRDQLNLLTNIFPDVTMKVLGINSDFSNLAQVTAHSNYTLNPNIRHVFEFMYRGQVIQLIAKTSSHLPVESFAYNICQAWSDGVTIYCTPLFKIGVEKEIFFTTGELYCDTGAYYKKILQRFPQYTYIDISHHGCCSCRGQAFFDAQVLPTG